MLLGVTAIAAAAQQIVPSLPPTLVARFDGLAVTVTASGDAPNLVALGSSSDLIEWTEAATFFGGAPTEFPLFMSPDSSVRFFRLESVPAIVSRGNQLFLGGQAPVSMGVTPTIQLDRNADGNPDESVQSRSDGFGFIFDTTGIPNNSAIALRYVSANGALATSWATLPVVHDSAVNTAACVPQVRLLPLTQGIANPGLCTTCEICPEESANALFSPTATPFANGVRLADGVAESSLISLSVPGISLGAGLNLSHISRQDYPGPAGNNVAGLGGPFIQVIDSNRFVLWNEHNRPLEFFSEGFGTPFASPSVAGALAFRDNERRTIRIDTVDGTSSTFAIGLPNQAGHLLRIRDPNGNTTTYHHNQDGNVVGIEADNGAIFTLAYMANGRLRSISDPIGSTWEFVYDAANRLVQILSPTTEFADIAPGTLLTDTALTLEAKPRRLTFAYASPGFPNHLTSITDERGAVTRAFTYDSQGRVSTQTLNGHSTQFIYEPIANPPPLDKLEPTNLLTRVIDPEGNVVDTEIVGPGQPGQFGIRRRITWTEFGKGNEPMRSGEPLYYEQRWVQDCHCLTPLVVTQPFSSLNLGTLVFDAAGIPQNWPHTRYTYNAERQVLTELYTDGANTIRTDMSYQPSGYGANGQFSKMLTRTEPRAFDDSAIYNGLNFVHTYEYDALGNMTKHTAPIVTRGVAGTQSITESWTRNTSGQVLIYTDPNGNRTINTYHSGSSIGGNINTKGSFFGYLATVTRGGTGSADPAVNLTTSHFYNALGRLTRMIDPMGRSYDTEYNDLGEVTMQSEPEVTLRNGQKAVYQTRHVYDGAGNTVMTRRTNIGHDGSIPANDLIDQSMSYDTANNLLAERREVDGNDSNDLVTAYAYDQNEQLIIVQKPEGNRLFRIHDERRLLLKEFGGVAPGANILTGYPADKRASNLAGASFIALTRADYDARANPVITYDGRGNSIIRGFDFRNRQVFEADQNRNGWVKHFDDAGNVLATEHGAMPAANGVLSQVIARNYARFDEVGRQYQTVQDINPLSGEVNAVDPAGPDNPSFLMRFDAGSRTIASVDANGRATTAAFDAADRRTGVTDALNNTMSTAYDPNSNVIEALEREVAGPGASGPPETYSTTFKYDELNRRTETRVRGLNQSIDHGFLTSYDSRSNTILMQDAEGKIAKNTYDDQNRLVTMQRFNRDPATVGAREQKRLEVQFDRNNRRIADVSYADVSNATTAQVTTYSYDHGDRRVREVYPDSADADDAVQIGYDANGNMISVRDQRGVTFAIEFDPANRLTQQNVSLPATVPGITRQTFEFDPLNRLTSARNNYARVDREYDALSRPTMETQSIRLDGSGFANGWEQPIRVACAYDRQSNPQGCTVSDGPNIDLVVTNVFDALNRLDTKTASYFKKTNRSVVDYNYFGPMRVQTKTLGNGARLTNTYDAKRRLQAMSWTDPSDLLAGFEYAYTPADNVRSERFAHDAGRYDHYAHNDRYELINATSRSPDPNPPTTWRDTFAYDDIYNRKSAAFGGPFTTAPSVVDTYAANRANEYTNLVRNNQAFDIQHDRAGSITQIPVLPGTSDFPSDELAVVRWDAFNCLFELEIPATGGKQHCRYDPFRRRIATLNSLTSLQGSRRFIYHEWSEIEERTFDPGSTLANAPSTLEQLYIEGPRLDEHLLAAVDRDGDGELGGPNLKNRRDISADQEFFFLHNRLGSTMALSDADNPARVLEYVRYTVYGEATVLAAIDNNADGREDTPLDLSDNAMVDPRRFSEEFSNPLLFTGRRFDDRTGLYHNRNRFLEPRTGRFLSRDPAWFGLDPFNDDNLYSYGADNPVNFTDALGLKSQNPCPSGWKLVKTMEEEPIDGKFSGTYERGPLIAWVPYDPVRLFLDYSWVELPGFQRFQSQCGGPAEGSWSVYFEKATQHSFQVSVGGEVKGIEIQGAYSYSTGTTTGESSSWPGKQEGQPCKEFLLIGLVQQLKLIRERPEAFWTGGRVSSSMFTRSTGFAVCERPCGLSRTP